jgi:hypothetical protein
MGATVARVDRASDVEVGDDVTLRVEAAKVLLFDPASGQLVG